MANLYNFDANQHEGMKDFSPIPEGKYLAAIVESTNKPTKNGSGSYLELKFQVLEGEHQGRNLWTRLNLENANADAVRIAQCELADICRAVGILQPQDSISLHDRPMVVTVKKETRKDTGTETNRIVGYASRHAPAKVSRAAAGAPAPKKAAPWQKPAAAQVPANFPEEGEEAPF